MSDERWTRTLRIPVDELRLCDIIARTNYQLVPPELVLDPDSPEVRERIDAIRRQYGEDQTKILEAGIGTLHHANYLRLEAIATYAELLELLPKVIPEMDETIKQDFRERGLKQRRTDYEHRITQWKSANENLKIWRKYFQNQAQRGDRSKIDNILNHEKSHGVTLRCYIPGSGGPNLESLGLSTAPILVVEKEKTLESVRQKIAREGVKRHTQQDATRLTRRYRKRVPGSLAEPYAPLASSEEPAGIIPLDDPPDITDMSGIKLVYRTEREMRKGIADFVAKAREKDLTIAEGIYGEKANEDYFQNKKRKSAYDAIKKGVVDLCYEAVHILFESPSNPREVIEIQFTTVENTVREFFGSGLENHRIYEARKGYMVATPKTFRSGNILTWSEPHKRLYRQVTEGWLPHS